MKYSGIKTNERLRFVKCPVCGNDEFSYEAEFCRVCGSAIYNYCQDLYDESGYRISAGCGRPNPGNARYCEYCGNPTLLYKFLSVWEEEKTHIEKFGPFENDSFEINENPENTDELGGFEEIASTSPEDLSDAFEEFLDEDEIKRKK